MTPTVKPLSNGAQIILAPNPNTRTVSVVPGIRIGSRFEPTPILGLSHFVEHLVFRGTAKYPSSEKVSRAVDRLGGHINASTNTEMTDIQVMTSSTDEMTCADIAMELLCAGLFRDDDIEQERPVVCDEIKRYEAKDGRRAWYLLNKAVYGDHPLGRPIAGYVENIENVTPDQIRAFWRANYVPNQTVVTLAGNYSAKVQEYVEERLLSLSGSMSHSKTPPTPMTSSETFVAEANEPRAALYLGFNGPQMDTRGRTAMALLGEILGGYMSSRLFIEIRDKQSLCYSVSSGLHEQSDVSTMYVSMDMDPKDLAKSIAALGVELRRVLKDLTEEELASAKSYTSGSAIIDSESSLHVAQHLTSDMLVHNRIESIEEKVARYNSITLDEVQQVAQMYLRNTRTAIVAPADALKGIEDVCKNELGVIAT